MLNNIKTILVNEDGATLVEYALIVALISVACIAVIGLLGAQIKATFTSVTASLKAA